MIQWGLIGWIACCASLGGAALVTSYSRRKMFWGWLLFFIGNACWIAYGVTIAAIPLIFYNTFRALFSLRGARNNTLKRKLEVREQRKLQDAS